MTTATREASVTGVESYRPTPGADAEAALGGRGRGSKPKAAGRHAKTKAARRSNPRRALDDTKEQVSETNIAALVDEFTELARSGVARPASVDLALPVVWGTPPSPSQLAEAEMANLAKTFVARRAVIDASISRAAVAALLEVSEQSVTKQIKAHRIVGVKNKGYWAIPRWQLDAGSEDGLLPGIRELAMIFPGGPVTLSLWAQRPNIELNGLPPRDVLAANRVDEVIDVVKAMTAAGW